MKKYVVTILIFLGAFCNAQTDSLQTNAAATTPEDEYEIVVFDTQYETFLASRATPISQYSEETLKSRNQFLVQEWNSRVMQPNRNRDIYEVAIDYDSREKYGLEFEYRLYQFFAFVSWKYGEKFTGLRNVDVLR